MSRQFRRLPLVLACLPCASALAAETPVAWDMLGSTSSNLVAHVNAFAGAFSDAGDGAQKYQRGVSATIPFQVLDDSLVSFPSDTLGIIDDNNSDEFFGITDTVNGDNNSGDVLATWEFDISGATDLGLSLDFGAMGDFESSDVLTVSASIDGGAAQTLFSVVTDDSAANDYQLAGGAVVTLNDPATLNGTLLGNQLQTFRAAISGTGSSLLVTVTANTDGGSEAYALQNLVVLDGFEDGAGPVPVAIHEVQGSGDISPLDGANVTIEAVVVGDFQNNGEADSGELNGFFVQEEDADVDGDPLTSEGVFVYYPGGAVDVAVGDLVEVTGLVSEFNGLTEVTASDVVVMASGQPLPSAGTLTLPVADIADFEPFEGMLVTLPQSLVISEYFNFDRYGEIVLALPLPGEARPMTATAVELPGSNGYMDRADLNARSRITLDDGRTSQNPDPAIHPNGAEFTLANRFRGGDLVADTTGVLNYSFGLYRVQPTTGAAYTAANPRPASAPAVGGSLKVASFNVLNYFTTLDDSGAICGPAMNLDCRGADNAEEFERQRSKIIAALAKLDAAVVGLIELENNSAAIDDLVAGLNDQLGAGTYAAVATGAIGGDAIQVGFIYQPALVSTLGDYAVLDSSFDADYIDDKNRPALAQTFMDGNGGVFTAVVNHLKSKGSDCDDIGDPDIGDGQGNCNGTRTDAARVLGDWLATDPTDSGDGDFLVLGDLNSYDKEDPIIALQSAGYVDLLASFGGEYAYSYVFDGQYGYLDYAMANGQLAGQVSGAAPWQINADEPDILDYDTSFKQPAQDALFEANEFRSSDHDPVVVGLDLNVQPREGRDCVRGGWRDLSRPDGTPFANARQCLIYWFRTSSRREGSEPRL
ncbi:ExeM/NucH family extracellular endonuclease [Mangrovimicrobium sediminis]|uniref:ExeM/NucH family extracellular endonuclease n=1 Tax=Mangrovimicrobium sediminis TaxID=2562682 RepID=A0A4Z0M7V3_9GAMM|nr:ExeM/NucH family extracellular endonuclease [Haliea sp. SAOS-164]TGD75477.1 ExeM/NucH family extracellular endonuclease [Haliea sp. SAOS-164]